MLYRKGADPEALDRAARELNACAGEVEGIRANGTRALAVLGRSWGGADADAAQESWRATSTALSSLGSTLDRMAARLGDNARAQRSASGCPREPAHAGAVAPVRARRVGLGRCRGARLNRPSPTVCGAPGPRRSISSSPSWPRASTTARAPTSFDALDASQLEALGIDPRTLTGPGGFAANIYRDANGDYVLAFAGTDPTSVSDWATNAQQGMGGLSAQHLQAIALAQHLASGRRQREHGAHGALTRRRSREHGLRRDRRPGRDLQCCGRPSQHGAGGRRPRPPRRRTVVGPDPQLPRAWRDPDDAAEPARVLRRPRALRR